MILCTYAFDNGPVRKCTEISDELADAIEDDTILKIAHNVEFDMCVCKYVLKLDISFTDWYDNAYRAAYNGYPRKLAYLAIKLGTQQKASQEEMLFFSKPVIVASEAPDDEWFAERTEAVFAKREEYPQLWESFEAYGVGDVEVMRETFYLMAELPSIEVFTMLITLEMNFNGFPFDTNLARMIYDTSKKFEEEASRDALSLYDIDNLRSVPKVKDALARNGVYLESLDKKKRTEEHHILELRDQATGVAFAKIPTAFKRICPDGRIRGEFFGRGAHTGRWSAKGTQPQNFARIINAGLVNEFLTNADTYSLLRQHLRLCIGYTDGIRDFSCADLSQIEARIVAWLANCKWRMEAFATGVDIYARSAEKMFNKERVTKDDIERQYGKNAELGFGYGGGHMAIANIQPQFYREHGVAKIMDLVQTWRRANPEICQLWYDLEDTFKAALNCGKAKIVCGGATLYFFYNGKDMKVLLPSGRYFYYRGAKQYGEGFGSYLYYLDYSRGGEAPVRTRFWGGTLLENFTQAIARDVLVDIMYNVKKREPSAMLCGTVHDEAWYEHDKGKDVLTTVLDEMSIERSWAKGLVLKGDGFTSDRYRK